MHIIINNSSMVPIYEQIIDQIKSACSCSLITSHFDLQTKNISTDKKKDGFGYKIFQIYLSSYQILNPHCYVSLHRITALQGTHLIRLKNCF